MGFSIRSTLGAALIAAAVAGIGLAAPLAAHASIPGPPLGGEPEWGAACAAPRSPQGPWRAAGFGAAALGVGWIARRRGSGA